MINQKRKFDIIAVYGNSIILNETKATPRIKYVDDFIRENEFFKYFPEYKGKKLIPIFSSIYVPDDMVKYLSKNKIYAMGMNEDTMDLYNPELED